MTEQYVIMVVVAVIAGLYVFTSIVLFKYPNFIHKRKNIKFTARNISHRGGAGENLENTMAAFQHAYSVGTEMLEIDCQLTKDGEVVVSHDNSLKRCSGEDVRISDLLYTELPHLTDHLCLDFFPGHITLSSSDDKQIPRLRDVFITFPHLPMNIDIKTDSDELISKVSDLVTEFHREDITAWGNASKKIAEKLYKTNCNIPLIFSFRRVLQLVALFYSGLLPFVPLKESFLEILMPNTLLMYKPFGEMTRKMRFFIRLLDKIIMRPSLFNHLKKRGIQTYVFVLNDDSHFDRAFKKGASGVMTDFPSRLQQFLDENPQYANT